MRWSLYLCAVLALSLVSVDAAIKKKNKKTPAEKSNKPQEKTVFERDLVTKEIKASKIVKEFKSYSDTKNHVKHYDGVTLAYITPWHYDGFDLSKTFKHKLNLLSPAWLAVRPMPNGHSVIIGLHNKREKWMKEVRKDHDNVKIVPRLNFEEWSPEDFTNVLGNEEKINLFADHLIRVCKENIFDGMVVEMWNTLSYQREDDLSHVISHIGERMRAADKLFILVIPPPLGKSLRPTITAEEVAELADYVDYFSLMTYDYSSPQNPGPIAPLQWMKECVEFLADEAKHKNYQKIRKKILMGMNFYGMLQKQGEGPGKAIMNGEVKKILMGMNFYGMLQKQGEGPGKAIMNGEVYTTMLDKFTPKFTWLDREGEHEGKFVNEEKVNVRFWYPTLYSLQQRLDLAKSLQVAGVSIWEIGQGLDYFFDLL